MAGEAFRPGDLVVFCGTLPPQSCSEKGWYLYLGACDEPVNARFGERRQTYHYLMDTLGGTVIYFFPETYFTLCQRVADCVG